MTKPRIQLATKINAVEKGDFSLSSPYIPKLGQIPLHEDIDPGIHLTKRNAFPPTCAKSKTQLINPQVNDNHPERERGEHGRALIP